LKGLRPVTDEDALKSILTGVGERCVELLRREPNVIADEQILTFVPHIALHQQRVEYLVIVRPTSNDVTLHEYRTDRHGAPIAVGGAAEGFASMWVHFFPANQGESRYRYLGKQKIGKRETIVLAFAQLPNKVKFPAEFDVEGTRISIFYQGIAWIDAADWSILRVREDLLAPRPDAKLNTFTARVRFGSVTVKKAATALWLPQEADLEWNLTGQAGLEQHIYTNYRLYKAKSKIIYTP